MTLRRDRLDPAPVLETVQRLRARIYSRFPERDLVRVCEDLVELVVAIRDATPGSQQRLRTARRTSRVLVGLVVVAAMALALRSALGDAGVERGLDWLPLVEAAVNDLVFAAIAVFFLYSLPERLQRGQLLALLHRLRSLAHIIDMHQLTKDPERLRPDFVPTTVSGPSDLTRDQMERYLDYCSEMLSLVGKAAALCAEESRDSLVLDTVGTVETLTASMSQKIWQKISVLSRL
ncbi:MAG: hypothetical protein LH468_08525 [Nocardioides sp.]|nr:hypothetical protein [Nocardioides sp.]